MAQAWLCRHHAATEDAETSEGLVGALSPDDPWFNPDIDGITTSQQHDNSYSAITESWGDDVTTNLQSENFPQEDPWCSFPRDTNTSEARDDDTKSSIIGWGTHAQEINPNIECTPKQDISLLSPDDPWYNPEIDGTPTISKQDLAVPASNPWNNDTVGPTEANLADSRVKRTRPGTKNPGANTFSSKKILLPTLPLKFSKTLNDAQTIAVKEMLCHRKERDITMIQGPPGTGKTTVIAAFISSILNARNRRVFITAHSNVGVKNIAEKLASYGIMKWKLIVSQDFHRDW